MSLTEWTPRAYTGWIELFILSLAFCAAPARAKSVEELVEESSLAYHHHQYDASIALSRQALRQDKNPSHVEALHYNIACNEALLGRPEKALDELREAARLGFLEWQVAENDPDLTTLRQAPKFQETLAEMKQNAIHRRIFDVIEWNNATLGWSTLHTFDSRRVFSSQKNKK